ncbi:serine/threonine-protein kinase haspin homolog isoform X2 [Drosophila bipectinata]|uniref:serine/threonine-protein kinase haspin homolog isoform X2 n=1 Tax=Drosophila bipectinata TaxID=42026 RepID=UPI0038B24555
MEDTIPDEVWKDSFDKLLDIQPKLRNLNIIKHSVRASLNIDSSVENSKTGTELNSSFQNKESDSLESYFPMCCISTPYYCGKKKFPCEMSPITGIKLDGLECNKRIPKNTFYKKKVYFEDSLKENKNLSHNCEDHKKLLLKPGKWRKSLNTWRRTHNVFKENGCVSSNGSCVTTISRPIQPFCQRKSVLKKTLLGNINFKKEILEQCQQSKPTPFDLEYATSNMLNTKKIGEGAYGEVFRYTLHNGNYSNFKTEDVVLKIIPIEGSIEINGEMQKTFEQILSEIIISKKMHSLRHGKNNITNGFANLNKVKLVRGKYPQHLIMVWKLYDDEKKSENDHPQIFRDDQLFLVLEMKYAGIDLSNYIFTNAEQSYNALLQVIITLAIGEKVYEFEHRDLHWGNILIEKTDKKQILYKFNGQKLTVSSKGVIVTIIDYTLSRVTIDECCHFNDLSTDDELFSATGDYQYDIYRMMRKELGAIMHSVGIHSAMAIKRQRKRRDEQKRARERRYSTQSSESGDTFHSPTGSVRRKYHHSHAAQPRPRMIDSQVVTSIGMLHIGIVFIVFGVFLCGAGIIPDETMSWNVFSSSAVWWNEVTCTGLFSLGLGLFLLILNCLISRKEEEDLEDYVQRQLTRSRSDVSVVDCCSTESINSAPLVGRAGLNSSGDALLEKIVEEETPYLNDRSAGISPIDIENDTKLLLRRESIKDGIDITRM